MQLQNLVWESAVWHVIMSHTNSVQSDGCMKVKKYLLTDSYVSNMSFWASWTAYLRTRVMNVWMNEAIFWVASEVLAPLVVKTAFIYIFSLFGKVVKVSADVTWPGRLFQICELAMLNARLPTIIHSHINDTSRSCELLVELVFKTRSLLKSGSQRLDWYNT